MKVLSPRFLGAVGLVGPISFAACFLILGFIQTGYDPIKDTVSMLALGQGGFLLNVCFILSALAFAALGLGFGLSIYQRIFNPITLLFGMYSTGFFLLSIFTTDKLSRDVNLELNQYSWRGFLHIIITIIFILMCPVVLYVLVKKMRQHAYWRSLVPYTIGVLLFNFFFGVSWFCLANQGLLYGFKGIFQRVLMINICIWTVVVAQRLYSFPVFKKQV